MNPNHLLKSKKRKILSHCYLFLFRFLLFILHSEINGCVSKAELKVGMRFLSWGEVINVTVESKAAGNVFVSIESHYLYIKGIQMLTKEKVNKSINNLPDSFTIDELIDQLILMEKVEEGGKQSENGKVISNEDVCQMIDRWSK